jgi:hypothetical protein
MSINFEAAISIKRFAASYDQRRITTARLGATTATLGATTGRRTTAAPPAATQPARTTPAAQTTALASMVLRAVKPPSSNREMIMRFIALLLKLGCDGTDDTSSFDCATSEQYCSLMSESRKKSEPIFRHSPPLDRKSRSERASTLSDGAI